MDAIKNLLKKLDGNKTYLGVGLGSLTLVAADMGWVPEDWLFVILGAITLWTGVSFRQAQKKSENAAREVAARVDAVARLINEKDRGG